MFNFKVTTTTTTTTWEFSQAGSIVVTKNLKNET